MAPTWADPGLLSLELGAVFKNSRLAVFELDFKKCIGPSAFLPVRFFSGTPFSGRIFEFHGKVLVFSKF